MSLSAVIGGCGGGTSTGIVLDISQEKDLPSTDKDTELDSITNPDTLPDIEQLDTPDTLCKTVDDCAYLLTDAAACQVAVCTEAGVCELASDEDGAVCQLTDQLCVLEAECHQGVCVALTEKTCNDAGPCETGSCDPTSGECVYLAVEDGMACDDLNQCTFSSTCQSGNCVGTEISCDDEDSCTVDSCEPTLGCVHEAVSNGTPCDDGNFCTEEDRCVEGNCAGGGDTDCDDGNPCTVDLCDAVDGCQHQNLSDTVCSDGNPCTVGDICQVGVCVSGTNECPCSSIEDCASHEDSDLCNGTLVCGEDSLCVVDPGTVVQCVTQGDTDCLKTMCVPEFGACMQVKSSDGTACSDGDVCSFGDKCSSGVCTAGNEMTCDDHNPCTTDSCQAGVGCVFENKTGACEDGNSCTIGDSCSAGLCLPGQNMCSCTGNSDCVQFNDDDLCNGSLICVDSVCVIDPVSIVYCQDPSNPCLKAECAPETGECEDVAALEGLPCDDGSSCTTDDACQSGTCSGMVLDCDDDNTCTEDTCDPGLGCLHVMVDNGSPCDDGNICTNQVCSNGQCAVIGQIDCDDQNDCTQDLCDPVTGCSNVALTATACSDGDPCTGPEGVDECLDGACVPGVASCGCSTNDDCAAFEDGDLCNGVYICEGFQCVVQPGSVVTCDVSADTDCSFTICQPETGECVLTLAEMGTECDDGNLCTEGDACFEGFCVPEGDKSCQDSNPCTYDACLAEIGCVHEPIDVPCDDGNHCTTGDVCNDGVCVGDTNICMCEVDDDCLSFDDADLCNGSYICVDNDCVVDEASVVVCPPSDNTCIVVECVPETGECAQSTLEDGMDCEDGDVCTEDDVCVEGVCEPGFDVVCDDGNPCTAGVCDSELGCQYGILIDTDCEDGNPCTQGDTCVDGTCTAGTNTCDCQTDGDCAESEDGNPCNGVLTCLDNICQVDQASIVVCDGANDTECTKNTCNPDDGLCAMTPVLDGDPCEDWDICTEFSSCFAGECVGTLVDCDDNNDCTDDVCIPEEGGCVHEPNNDSCDDNNLCTSNDYCVEGECVGEQLVCNDNNTCTLDSCDPLSGCKYANKEGSCDDSNLCTTVDTCVDGVCQGEEPLDCDDSNVCTTDTCDPVTGCTYKNNILTCEDGEPCTANDVCQGGLCVAGSRASCNDSNPCTIDYCENGIGCKHDPMNGNPCATGDLCMQSGTCQSGECIGQPLSCDDNNPCTQEQCDPTAGCVYTYSNGTQCEDGNLCTTGDSCQAGVCLAGADVDCDDNVDCTLDSCLPESGCVNDLVALNGTPCDDRNLCTEGDLCSGGACAGSPIAPCNDNNPCTEDSCDPLLGCVYSPIDGGSCDDGDPCTVETVCVTGICTGTPKDCDDGDPCTIDLCDSEQGCFQTSVADEDLVECDDEDACTNTDLCVGGVCTGSDQVDCDDDNVCTDDSCNTDTGECEHGNNTLACSDGSLCTLNDVCANGVCVPGAAKVCNDNNVCTDDVCLETNGKCAFVANDAACSDGSDCTDGDYCSSGACIPGFNICECQNNADCLDEEDGDPCNGTLICKNHECVVDPATIVVCDPANDTECRVNRCNPATGTCVLRNEPNHKDCDDNNLCTTSDSCFVGVCSGTPVVCTQDSNPCTSSVCQPADGCVVTNVTGPCSDNNVCTTEDTCNAGVCTGQPFVCNDDNVCTQDFCAPSGGQPQCFFQNTTGSCSDKNICTINDTCTAGTCVGTAVNCDDGNVCTNDWCDAAAGCVHNNNTLSCSDSNPCTVSDTCSNGVCAGTPKNCNDNNPCTNDSCASNGTCLHIPNTVPCNDNNDCTSGDVCSNAVCHGTEITCNDNNICTLDSCDPTSGCVYIPSPGSSCDDGNICTGSDTCSDTGSCAGEAIFNCCHNDSECNQGYECNIGDCVSFRCEYTMVQCNDNNSCTADYCMAGDCAHPPLAQTFTIYFEDFDGTGDHGWRFELAPEATNRDVIWTVSDINSSSPDKSFYAGNPATQTYDGERARVWAVSPLITIPDTSDLSMTFRYWADFEENTTNFDFVDVFAAIDGGPKVGIGSRIYASSDWTTATFSLAAFGGHDVRIYLLFDTGDNTENNAEGFYFDDLEITGGAKAGCCMYDSDCEDANLCTEDICSSSFNCVFQPQPGTYLAEDFGGESYPSNWTKSTNNVDLYWAVDNGRYTSSTYSLYAGNTTDQTYNHGAGVSVATTETLDLLLAISPRLTFSLFADFQDPECDKDYLTVAAIDVTDPNNPVTYSAYTRCNGTWGVFETVSVDLTPYRGKKIKLRYTFTVNASRNAGEGIYVDDIRVEELADTGSAKDCCQTVADCSDGNPCTIDMCRGETGGGICFYGAVPKVIENFDDAVANNWEVTPGSSDVTWHISARKFYSAPFSLHASQPSSHQVVGDGNTYAYSESIKVAYPGSGSLKVGYRRWMDLDNSYNNDSVFSVRWEYRTSSGGAWIAGGDLETLTSDSTWTAVSYNIPYPTNTYEVRIRFRYEYGSSANCDFWSTCPEGPYIEDFTLGWSNCLY